VVRKHSDKLRVIGLSVWQSIADLEQQVQEFRPDWAVIGDHATTATDTLTDHVRVFEGNESLLDLVASSDIDTVVSAMVGAAGLPVTLAAVEAGKRVAVANKESLVIAGSLLTHRARETGAAIFPVDSEHSAVFQCLQAGKHGEVKRIILTASGGPFRGWSSEQLKSVTPEMALKHPTWDMGPKITIDSATMMNKALEIIEARWLFGYAAEQISVVIHPQSVIHSFVEFRDGAVIAQLSPPDMRLPIQYALLYPDRLPCPADQTDWMTAQTLQLLPPDFDAFPALKLGFEAADRGGTCGAVLNAANEVAVERFLNCQLPFLSITRLVQDILSHHTYDARPDLQHLMSADRWAREEASRWKP
jgi:1-deoxy-D-xylulose-5-phosphate reductoisomerase